MAKMRVRELFSFMNERHLTYERRFNGCAKPWTSNPILQQYRFCNVYRELDKVTQWIANQWRAPNQGDPYLWFALTVARFINWPATLAHIRYPVPFKPDLMLHRMQQRASVPGLKIFTGAYMIRSRQGEDKVSYVVRTVLPPLWKDRDKITDVICNRNLGTVLPATLQDMYNVLRQYYGFGSFMAGQVIADLKYAKPYLKVRDWTTFAVSGPGSRRGLARVCGIPFKGWAAWNEKEWYDTLLKLKLQIDPMVRDASMPPVHAQDLQNCLCEFDKHERVRLGEGRPRSTYPGIEGEN